MLLFQLNTNLFCIIFFIFFIKNINNYEYYILQKIN